MAKKEGFVLEPIIVVHDSNTNYFPVDKLWDIKKFYDKNFTEFCRDACGVPFLFDLYNKSHSIKYTNENLLNCWKLSLGLKYS